VSVIKKLTSEFLRLPGVGPSTAQRLVYHLMKRPREEMVRLADAIKNVAEKVRPCVVCGNFSEVEKCDICSDPRRDGTIICVVEEAFEVRAIEKSGEYRGLYHVLGGRLSPLDGIGPEELAVASLIDRIKKSEAMFKEMIVATNSSVEGEVTAVYLENLIRPMGIRVTRLARGIPVGSDLEYVDGSTIVEALAGRREM